MKYLDAVEARAKAATAGPWTDDVRTGCVAVYQGPSRRGCMGSPINDGIYIMRGTQTAEGVWTLPEQRSHDAAFIAHARTDLPRLCEIVRRMSPYTVHHSGCNLMRGRDRCDCGLDQLRRDLDTP